ncbi:protein translocase subunit secG [Filimonas lacunae]|uniref:Protein-export membrane protein SecG n=1 Tax=Filimonas lacunae TaxID=477680 RepID=A0A173MJG1_9BACT|nr:preprotein translocase subunit SecG [Filimonas lacunae]BAV07596.1 protein-export membrane protein [Filimonas lacunae]SIT29840.1 protein translocase subunit secG [Filimonas lacunae]
MTLLFFILIVLASVILGFIVLVQNPKGGGLSGNIAGFSNQFMGVKQTTDVLEKGTWLFSGIIAVLCLVSTLFFRGNAGGPDTSILQKVNTNTSAPAATQQGPAPVSAPTAADSNAKP